MTKTVDIRELKNSIQAVIALTKGGDEVVLEENGEPVVKVIPLLETAEPGVPQRILGLGTGKGYPLADSRLYGHIVECDLHAWRFDVRSGECFTKKSCSIESYEVMIEDGWIKIGV